MKSSTAVDATPLPRFVVFGEALTDFVRTGTHRWSSAAGGACWNVARVAATLGASTAWAGSTSDDVLGREIVERSRAAGLDLRFVQSVSKAPLIAMVYQTDPPRYFFCGNDTADLAFDVAQLPDGWRNACEVAHFGSISLVREPLAQRLEDIARDLKRRGIRISYDVNWRELMDSSFPARFERMVRIADIIKLSDEDLSRLFPELGEEAGLARVRSFSPQATILFTRGAGGLSLHTQTARIDEPAIRVVVRDTVGAGDACIGGFIASQLTEPTRDLAWHLRFAAATAAAACTRAGAFAPARNRVMSLL